LSGLSSAQHTFESFGDQIWEEVKERKLVVGTASNEVVS
jgi:hypothetical protein